MIIKHYKLAKQDQRVPFVVVQNQHGLFMPIGDLHYGVPNFPVERLINNLQWAMDRGAVFLGMGDFMDFTSGSQRTILGGTREEVQGQMDALVIAKVDELYDILAFSGGRWVGLLGGNHYWQFQDGTTSDQYLCGKLGCDFLGTSTIIKVHPVGAPRNHPEASTTIFAHHGIGSSRKAGGHLNRVEDILEWVECDVALMGHSHAKVLSAIDYQVITPDKVHTHRTRIIARTGSWFKGYGSSSPLPLDTPARKSSGSYVEKKAYTPTALGSPLIGIGFEQIKGSRFFKPSLHASI